MKQTHRDGFTLIELLMVISIIGILVAITVASLVSARNKAADKAIMSNMLTVRNQAGLYFDTNKMYGATDVWPAPGSYNCTTGMFTSDAVLAAAVAKLGTYSGVDYVACNATADSYVVAAQLKSTHDYFCMDSKSYGKVVSVDNAPDGLIGTGTGSVINMGTASCN